MSAGAPTIPELVAELQGRWRAFTSSDDQERAEYLLGDVWREISRIPTLVERMADDEALAADARMIACNAAKRAMVAEGRLGVVEEERTDGPLSRRRKYATTSATAELTDAERASLLEEAAATSDDAPTPRWTGDVVPAAAPAVVLPHWPRDGSAYARRPW